MLILPRNIPYGDFILDAIHSQQKYIWTSGRLCDFKGWWACSFCWVRAVNIAWIIYLNSDRPDLQPVAVNGWFWTSELQKIAAATDRQQTDWSENGGIGQPQPDNRELQQGGARENCIAVLNNFYNDGVHWVRENFSDLVMNELLWYNFVFSPLSRRITYKNLTSSKTTARRR